MPDCSGISNSKIIKGQIPARILNQNDLAVAMLDAFPLADGHTLVVPKIHYSKIQDMDRDTSASVFSLVRKISAALEKAVNVNSTTTTWGIQLGLKYSF
jgi:histidine triad (HIT) family protein